ncbi:hypothetical protein D1818_20985 [Aquimarina sp. BL5]|uniref:DUF6584 family protein n=1 Tax=Aquimarina sp. BL5 TaxID=1714860 RepID=UPI000E47ED3A|nr:DUF6584 family protein [Aquimarina sp. BL5]AXT53181.1 hypothetical protein D1818_20985 [Aquimarina sp. BL5]RKN02061.1 hypothetical protein D7036_17060 [Aquimarina sp. BL5]
MNIKDKLTKIESEIDSGLKLKAADRLRNLINQYPNEIELWNRLAELYYESGFLDAAGRYWILTEPSEDRIKKCVEIYEKSVNYSGTKILQNITFRGDKSQLSEFAQKKLTDLESDSKKKSNYIPKFVPKLNKQKRKTEKHKDPLSNKLIGFILGGFLLSIPVFAIIGLIKVIDWIFF